VLVADSEVVFRKAHTFEKRGQHVGRVAKRALSCDRTHQETVGNSARWQYAPVVLRSDSAFKNEIINQ
jgi:hypothetical protein